MGWKAAADEQSKEAAIDAIRQKVLSRLERLANLRVAHRHRTQWEVAYDYRGPGSTFSRSQSIMLVTGLN